MPYFDPGSSRWWSPCPIRNKRIAGIGGSARGFSVLEVLMVVALLSIMIAIVVPSSEPSAGDQLLAAAYVMMADLEYAQSLAIANDSSYTVTFDSANDQYELTHTGSNGALDQLPAAIFPSPNDTATKHVTQFDDFPNLRNVGVGMLGAVSGAGTSSVAADVEFNPLGETTASDDTTIWLVAGEGTRRRYVSLQINAATGLTSVGEILTSLPTEAQVLAMDVVPGRYFARVAAITSQRTVRAL